MGEVEDDLAKLRDAALDAAKNNDAANAKSLVALHEAIRKREEKERNK